MLSMIRALSSSLFLSALALQPFIASAQVRPPQTGPRLILEQAAERPVRIASAKVETRITGSFAVTTLELSLHNPNQRVLEGSVEFPLTEGQQVIGMASEVDGALREAVAVEKAKGRQVFEDVVRSRIDPALLEKTLGNNYRLRVYPIRPNGETRLAIRILENLKDTGKGQLFRLPLGFASDLKRLAVLIKVDHSGTPPQLSSRNMGRIELKQTGRSYEVAVERSKISKEAEVSLLIPESAAERVYVGEQDGQRSFYAELPIETLSKTRPHPKRLAVIWDASMSGLNRKRDDELTLLRRYIASLGTVQVTLHVLRNTIEAARSFSIQSGDSSALADEIRKLAYDGATDLSAIPHKLPADAALLFSDGLQNFGGGQIALPGIPISVVNSAVQADTSRLRHIARATGGSFVDLSEGISEQSLKALMTEPPSIARIDGEGLAQLVSQPIQRGDRRIAIAGIIVGANPRLAVTLRGTRAGTLKLEQRAFEQAPESPLAARRWAQLRIAELEADRALHRGEILRLSRTHTIVSSEMSLIVLERISDYVRHNILPPAELRGEYDEQVKRLQGQKATARNGAAEALLAAWKQRRQWWGKEFPKDTPKRPDPVIAKSAVAAAAVATASAREERRALEPSARASAPMPMAAPAPLMAAPPPRPAPVATATAVRPDPAATPEMGVTLKKWTSDAPYIARLSQATPDQLYAIYLDQRPDNANSSAFFLDVSSLLADQGKPELALRVLSNLAEMQIENRDLLRVLASRLVQAKQPALAVPILRRVLEIAPDEPHSLRDLALALAAAGKAAEASGLFNQLIQKTWDGRFGDIAEIALAELNALLAAHPEIDRSPIDPRLIDNLPVALRIVLSWDNDNTDIDLAVIDPNGERVSYDHKLSYQGGRISRDVTSSYGPEEFILKVPKPGKYTIHANFFGHRQQVLSSATTVQAEITTAFGTAAAKTQTAILRLRERKDNALVAEIEVK